MVILAAASWRSITIRVARSFCVVAAAAGVVAATTFLRSSSFRRFGCATFVGHLFALATIPIPTVGRARRMRHSWRHVLASSGSFGHSNRLFNDHHRRRRFNDRAAQWQIQFASDAPIGTLQLFLVQFDNAFQPETCPIGGEIVLRRVLTFLVQFGAAPRPERLPFARIERMELWFGLVLEQFCLQLDGHLVELTLVVRVHFGRYRRGGRCRCVGGAGRWKRRRVWWRCLFGNRRMRRHLFNGGRRRTGAARQM